MTWRMCAAALAAAVALGGAALGGPVFAAAQKTTAFIKGTHQSTFLASHLAIAPGNVDGKRYRKLFTFKPEVEVPAGNRVVDVYIDFQFGFNEMPYRGTIPFRANLSPGRRYETRGKISGRNVVVWIADAATHKPASKILTITAKRCYIRPFCPPVDFAIRPNL